VRIYRLSVRRGSWLRSWGTGSARVIHPGKEAAHGLTGPEDVRLARRLRRANRREHRLGRCGTLRRRRQLDCRDLEQRRRAPHGCHHLCGVGRVLARGVRAVRQADERDPQGRVLGLARVRRLGRDDDRHRRPGRSHHAAQAGALRRIPACSRRGTVRPIAGRDQLDRRVPPCHPPGRPGCGRADLPRTAHHRADEHHRLRRRSRRPRLRGAPGIEPDRQPGSASAKKSAGYLADRLVEDCETEVEFLLGGRQGRCNPERAPHSW
jgi:hypothetical protein